MVRRGINLKETLLLTRDMDATVQFKWRLPTTKWGWWTPLDTFVPRQPSHIYLHTPPRCPKTFRTPTQLDTRRHVSSIYHRRSTQYSNQCSVVQVDCDNKNAEGGGVSQVLGSEIGQKYVFDEETRDPEPPWNSRLTGPPCLLYTECLFRKKFKMLLHPNCWK